MLPGAAYAEKHGTYVNTEGRVQRGERARLPAGRRARGLGDPARVSELAGKKLPFDNFDQLRAAMVEEFPQLGRDGLIDLPWAPPKLDAKAEGPVRYPIGDFFLTNAICRASPTRCQASGLLRRRRKSLDRSRGRSRVFLEEGGASDRLPSSIGA